MLIKGASCASFFWEEIRLGLVCPHINLFLKNFHLARRDEVFNYSQCSGFGQFGSCIAFISQFFRQEGRCLDRYQWKGKSPENIAIESSVTHIFFSSLNR
jgi:hypothetical protein